MSKDLQVGPHSGQCRNIFAHLPGLDSYPTKEKVLCIVGKSAYSQHRQAFLFLLLTIVTADCVCGGAR